MQSTNKTQVSFFTTKIDQWNNKSVGRPNHRTVEQLGLKNKGEARIGFTVKGKVTSKEGAVIYARKRAKPGGLNLAWDTIDRSKSRKSAAEVAQKRLEKRVNNLPAPAITTEVILRMNDVRTQLTKWGTVAAGDLQSLFDSISHAEKAHAAKVEADSAAARQLQFDMGVKAAIKGAAQLVLADAQDQVAALTSNVKPPAFRPKAASDFRAFIYATARASDGEMPPYELARAFAAQWIEASPDDVTCDPKARHLIDSLVKLVIRGGKTDVPPAAVRHLPEFMWEGKNAFLDADNTLFVRGEKPLGEGGFGSAYVHKGGDRTVVVKELKSDDKEAVLAEAQAHAQAQTGEHDYIVGLLGIVQPPDAGTMLVLEHAPNGDAFKAQQRILSELQKEQITPQDASHARMTMFADMAKGVKQAHASNVMHLDLKLENFFVGKSGKLKLGDFGTARKALAEFIKSPVDSPDHSAPELVNNLQKEGLITYKADVWTLGVILYELNSPRSPFVDGKQVNPRFLGLSPTNLVARPSISSTSSLGRTGSIDSSNST